MNERVIKGLPESSSCSGSWSVCWLNTVFRLGKYIVTYYDLDKSSLSGYYNLIKFTFKIKYISTVTF